MSDTVYLTSLGSGVFSLDALRTYLIELGQPDLHAGECKNTFQQSSTLKNFLGTTTHDKNEILDGDEPSFHDEVMNTLAEQLCALFSLS